MSVNFRRVALAVSLTLGFVIALQSFQSTQASSRWVAIGKLQSARAGACSVTLSDGRVLITGGESSRGVLNSAEVFDETGNFTDAAPMLSSHADHVCALLPDGLVLVAGGR